MRVSTSIDPPTKQGVANVSWASVAATGVAAFALVTTVFLACCLRIA